MENINQILQEVSTYEIQQGDNILDIAPEVNELTIEIIQQDTQTEVFIEHISSIAEINITPSQEPSQVTLFEATIQGAKGGQGEVGVGLEYTWSDTSLGIKREDEPQFVFTDLKGRQGENLKFDDLSDSQREQLRGDVGSTSTNYANIFYASLL